MERQSSKLRRYGERDLDEVVEIGIARYVAQIADVVSVQRAEGIETPSSTMPDCGQSTSPLMSNMPRRTA